jgi:hypothetical protein
MTYYHLKLGYVKTRIQCTTEQKFQHNKSEIITGDLVWKKVQDT